MIYTSSKALQYLSIPVYTIFKNLTIILIAYGEVIWFGGSVTRIALFSFGLMVLSSVIAAWADIQHALQSHGASSDTAAAKISTLNAGYVWMLVNCLSSASYVLGMRKRIKLTNFRDFDSKSTIPPPPSIITNTSISNVLQQRIVDSYPTRLHTDCGGLVFCKRREELPVGHQEQSHHRDAGLRSIDCLHLLHFSLVRSSHLIDNVLHGGCPE